MSAARTPRTVAAPAGPTRVDHVLVLADGRKPAAVELLGELGTWLADQPPRVTVEDDLIRYCAETRDEDLAPEDLPDLVVVIGGDGSILSAVRTFARRVVPVLGINVGRVGFLATVDVPHWRTALEEVLAGGGMLEERMRLEAELSRRDASEPLECVALNDAVLERRAAHGLPTFSLHVDGQWVTDYRADGLIVATPSGSTAHSLAAGGPLLAPDMQAWIVTPICAHALAHRPIVLHPDSRLEIEVLEAEDTCTLAFDGQGYHALAEGDRVAIARHPVPFPLLVRGGIDAYRRIRDRLGWSGSMGARRDD